MEHREDAVFSDVLLESGSNELDRELTIGHTYVEHRSLLLFVACRKFHIPEADAENLIQEVFLSFLQSKTPIINVRAWFVAAMCNASRHYLLATRRTTDPLPSSLVDQTPTTSVESLAFDSTGRLVQMEAMLAYLQPRCREVLWLHYFEGRTAADVAKAMGTTDRYAEKLIHNCLKRVREIYFNLHARPDA
jgi:RNA polymerase sigma factor (sigma-70 family)